MKPTPKWQLFLIFILYLSACIETDLFLPAPPDMVKKFSIEKGRPCEALPAIPVLAETSPPPRMIVHAHCVPMRPEGKWPDALAWPSHLLNK